MVCCTVNVTELKASDISSVSEDSVPSFLRTESTFSHLGPSASHVPRIGARPGFVMNTVHLVALHDIRVQLDVETCQKIFVFW